MNKRRERSIQDLCDDTPTPSSTEVTSQVTKNFSSHGRGQKFEHRGKSGACNVCAAPCSSCSHGSKVLMNSTDESAEETCAEHVPADCDKLVETLKLNQVSTVSGMPSNSDSFSENAVVKASLRTPDAYASDDNVGHSKSEDRGALEGQDDCVSCVSGADEHVNIQSDVKGGKINSKTSGESSDKMLSNISLVGLQSQNSALVEIPTESADDGTDLQKDYSSSSRPSDGTRTHDSKSRVVEYNKTYTKRNLVEGSSEPLISSPTKEVELDDVCAEAPAMAQKLGKENDDMEVEPTDETDDSDLVEHDVKVCDICGDAGREELLAICCRCTDGAEHTYCMREMLSGVPEGDWLCEECSFVEQIKNEGLEKIERVDGCEKNSSSCQVSGEHVTSSEVDGQKPKDHLKKSGKRLRDDADTEVSSRVKRSALDSTVRSPKTSIFRKAATLFREPSSKNLERNSLQPSPDTAQVSSVPESAGNASDPRVKDYRGTFSKSNSFNSLSSKPKVKLVDQVVLQRQKSARERSSFRPKEGVSRSIGKSTSFKSLNPSRSDSKTETLSPRLSRIQDSETRKQRSSFDRQSSFRKEYLPMKSALGTSSSFTSRSEKKLVSRDASSSLTNNPNNHEAKPGYNDGKSGVLSRSSSHLGEFKRPSLHTRTAPGVSSTRGDNTEHKANQISPKEDHVLRSVEKSSSNVNDGPVDGLSRPRDSLNSTGRVTGGRFRPPGAKPQVVENDNVKAALEAVMRKPDLYRKHRPPGQSDVSSTSSVGGEIVSHQDRAPKFAVKKQFALPAELHERQALLRSSPDDSIKLDARDSVKQVSSVPAEGLSSFEDGVIPFDGKCTSNGIFSNVPEAMPLPYKSLAIPDNEYIWQGSFEICRSGKTVDLWDGLQAHLSTLASPKVNEAVNKFSNRIVLYEVPRLSTWPIQFQENGVGEDNIALYFFAKDFESYDKVYKVMLDNMMKSDLALKADINGVELLIFPSNQLPDEYQRWNMLFFLWAVFRVKKESHVQPLPESAKQVSAALELSPAVMSVSESRCSLTPSAKDLPAIGDTAPVQGVPAAEKLCSLLTSRAVNGDCDTKLPSLGRLDGNSKSSFSTTVQADDGKRCQESGEPFLEGNDISYRSGSHLPSHLHVMGSSGGSGREEKQLHSDQLVNRQQSLHPSNEPPTVSEEKTHERSLIQDEAQFRNVPDDLVSGGKSSPVKSRYIIDLNMECVEPQSLSPGTSQMSGGGDDACNNKPYISSETVNHEAPCSLISKNRDNEAIDKMDIDEACDKMDIDGACDKADIKENGERHLFPAESRPFTDEGWKISPFKQDRLHARAPILEVALGAESKPLSLGTQPLFIGRMDKRSNEEHTPSEANLGTQPLFVGSIEKSMNEEHGPSEATTVADDDVSASLSLSLGFPFPQ